MSDIAGPPAPKEIQSPIRGADKAAHVAKDPNSQNTRTGDQSREQAPRDQGEALNSRDPAVSIASSAAHLVSGQEITEPITKIDAEGRPIIVTETVTLALKPDAGLQPNDTVHLKVVDAGKQVTADLLRQNSLPVDPPIRLTLTVIEVHTSNQPQTEGSRAKPPTALDAPYRSPTAAQNAAANNLGGTVDYTADLTALISGKNPIPTIPVDNKQQLIEPAPTNALSSRSGTAIASSADLATLIQQQSTTAIKPPSDQVQKPVKSLTPSAPLTPSTTTISAVPQAATGPGIGPILNGVSVSGAPAIIQLLDPSISSVSPTEVASVTRIQTVTAAEARALPIGASVFNIGGTASGTATGELAKVETTRGQFILPATDAAPIAGELVRVSIGSDPLPPSVSAVEQTNDSQFRALFIEDKAGALPARVDVTFVNKSGGAAAANAGSATITSVQTVSAFFGADGPKTDLRLQTTRGDISLTVPSGVRPQVGDSLKIMFPSNTALPEVARPVEPQSHAPTETFNTAPTATAQIASHGVASEVPNILTNWPAMEESLAALVGTNSSAAANLVGKTAQGGSKLTNSLMFFLKAAGLSNGANWMGIDVEKALSRASQMSLSSLRSDIGQMATLAGETIGDWRPILIPFDARGGDVPLVALLLGQKPEIDPDAQEDKPNSSEQDDDAAQRFILQVQFSVLGDIQLDGNIRKKTFDLVVRSINDLPATLQRDASDLFYASLAANDFTGGIEFRQQETFSVDAAALIENRLRGRTPE